MATYYVSSVDGSDADDGSTWALAKATVAGALAVATTTGDVILVDSAHAYTAGAAISWNPSTGISVSIISTDRTNGGILAGAAESVGAANAAFNILTSGSGHYLYVDGMTLSAGSGNSSAGDFNIASVNSSATFKSCTFSRPSTSGSAASTIGSNAGTGQREPLVRFDGCTFTYASPNASAELLELQAMTGEFLGCTFALSAGSTPTTLIETALMQKSTRFVGCDFSAFAATNLVSVAVLFGDLEFEACKFHATTLGSVVTGTWGAASAGTVALVNCDSGDTEYKYAYYTREGALTVDTATYASDSATVAGQALSWKIVTTAAADEDSPFVTPWVSTWIDSTGSKTLSLELLYDSASNYDDREIWAEIEYLGNASYPISTVYSSRNANPFTGTGTDLTAGSATWTEALTNDNKDKITTTVTVNGKGLARARLYVAVASTTIYLDPQLRVA